LSAHQLEKCIENSPRRSVLVEILDLFPLQLVGIENPQVREIVCCILGIKTHSASELDILFIPTSIKPPKRMM
jgi:hypothetical protein